MVIIILVLILAILVVGVDPIIDFIGWLVKSGLKLGLVLAAIIIILIFIN